MSAADTPIEVVTDTGRFAIVPEWLIRSSLSDRAIRVYAVISVVWADRSDHDCWPSRRVIAETLGVSTSKIDRSLSELRRFGAIDIEPRFDAHGQTTNLYRIRRVPPTPLINSDEGCHQNSGAPLVKSDDPPSSNLTNKPESINQSQGTTSRSASTTHERAERFCAAFVEEYKRFDPQAKPLNITKAWRQEADRMFRIDGRDGAEVRQILTWLYRTPEGAFWAKNIASVPTFRAKYDRIRQAAKPAQSAPAKPVEPGTRQTGVIKL